MEGHSRGATAGSSRHARHGTQVRVAMVRESHGGAGQGVTLIRVVVRATERGKVLRARVGNVRTARHLRRECGEARVPTRVACARARYGSVWGGQGCLLRQATMGWPRRGGRWRFRADCVPSNNFNCFLTSYLHNKSTTCVRGHKQYLAKIVSNSACEAECQTCTRCRPAASLASVGVGVSRCRASSYLWNVMPMAATKETPSTGVVDRHAQLRI